MCVSRDVTTGLRHLLGAEIGLAECCCLPQYKAPWELPALGNPPCAACGVLYLWAERKSSLLHSTSLDQQGEKPRPWVGSWGEEAEEPCVKAAWEEGAKQQRGRLPLRPLPVSVVMGW